jgi:hypothetical protein
MISRVKKTLIIAAAVLGILSLACCGGVVAYILLSDPVYADPEDPCEASVTGPLSDLGTVADRKNKLVDAHGRLYNACAVTLKAGDGERLLTVVIDVPADSDAEEIYDTFRGAAAANAGGAIKEVPDVGAKAYAVHTVTGGRFGFELTFYDGNLFVCLALVSDGGLSPDEAYARLAAVADAVMTALQQSRGGDGWDD